MNYIQVEPEIGFPKGETKNRKEILIIEFDYVLQSQAMSVVLGLYIYSNENNLSNIFSKVKDIVEGHNRTELYLMCCQYTAENFLLDVLGFSKNEIQDLIEIGLSYDTYEKQICSDMAYGIGKVASASYIEKVIVVFNRTIHEHDISYLQWLFIDAQEKIMLSDLTVMMTLNTTFESYKPSTFIIGEKSTALNIINSDYYIDNQYIFLVPERVDNIDDDDKDIEDLQEKLIFGYTKYKPCISLMKVYDEDEGDNNDE